MLILLSVSFGYFTPAFQIITLCVQGWPELFSDIPPEEFSVRPYGYDNLLNTEKLQLYQYFSCANPMRDLRRVVGVIEDICQGMLQMTQAVKILVRIMDPS